MRCPSTPTTTFDTRAARAKRRRSPPISIPTPPKSRRCPDNPTRINISALGNEMQKRSRLKPRFEGREDILAISAVPFDENIAAVMTRQHCSKNDLAGGDLDLPTQYAEDDVLDSPISPTGGRGSDDESDSGGYETPITSPECSPDKSQLWFKYLSASKSIHSRFDGCESSDDEESAGFADCDSVSRDATPTVPASPAKDPRKFPFPPQGKVRPFSFQTSQRHPSALFGYCEQRATPRQRRLMAGGLRVSDRFVADRAGTPTKEALVLSSPLDKLSGLDKTRRQQRMDFDPFGPSPRRSVRLTERFATLRSNPLTNSRNTAGLATAVDDGTSRTRSTANDGAIWSVGGVMVTEGVPSTSNGRGGRVTSGTSAPHHVADFLSRVSTNEVERVHERRLALAMDMSQNAKMLDHRSPSSPLAGSQTAHFLSPPHRTWQDGTWKRDGPETRMLPL